jgi:hypothetical protein
MFWLVFSQNTERSMDYCTIPLKIKREEKQALPLSVDNVIRFAGYI